MFNKWFIILAITTLLINISCKKNTTSSENTAPTASFTTNPTLGTIATIFNFDASGCTDDEDPTSDLQVRWDWENDGTYDTDFSISKTTIHQYSTIGTYTIVLEVMDSGGLTQTTTKSISLSNTSPSASFTVDPTLGTTITTFTFDANNSSDIEDASTELQVRWDWDNDGTYDTDFSTTKTATHQYTIEGIYTVNLEAQDTDGLTQSLTAQITVTAYIVQYTGTVTDIDGNVYNTIQIGDQLWMAENLKVTKYRNGDAIPNVTNFQDWEDLLSGAFLNYNNDESYISTHGRLYNWYVIGDPRGVAPEGWHVPSDDEWKELEMYLGMSQADADSETSRLTGKVGQKLKSASEWYNGWNNDENADPEIIGTNESGFSALPSGYTGSEGITFDTGIGVIFWTSTELIGGLAWRRGLGHASAGVARYTNGNRYGFSIRCIKD